MVVYKTTNLVNNNFYVGKDSYNNPTYLGSGVILHHAIKKYGKENFKKEILEEATSLKDLADKEIKWIAKLNPSYNIQPGGTGGDSLSNHPDREKLIQKRIENYSDYARHIASKTHKGKTITEEHKNLIRKKAKHKFKKCKLIDPHGNVVKIKNGIRHFCKENNLDYSAIKRLFNEKLEHHRGWRLNKKKYLNKSFDETEFFNRKFCRNYCLQSPSGKIYKGTNLKQFCQENKLQYSLVNKLLNKNYRNGVNDYKGWKAVF